MERAQPSGCHGSPTVAHRPSLKLALGGGKAPDASPSRPPDDFTFPPHFSRRGAPGDGRAWRVGLLSLSRPEVAARAGLQHGVCILSLSHNPIP